MEMIITSNRTAVTITMSRDDFEGLLLALGWAKAAAAAIGLEPEIAPRMRALLDRMMAAFA